MNPDKSVPAADQTPVARPESAEQPSAETVVGWVVAALEDLKGIDIRVLDVRGHCNFADFMVFSSGTSDRHLKSQANSVVEKVKAQGVRPMGVEGDQTPSTEWVLVDLVDVLVHIMLPETRDHYQLEKLWSAQASAAGAGNASGATQAAYAGALDKLRGAPVSSVEGEETAGQGWDAEEDVDEEWDDEATNGDDWDDVDPEHDETDDDMKRPTHD